MEQEELARLCRRLREGEEEAAAAAAQAVAAEDWQQASAQLRLLAAAAAHSRSQACFSALLQGSREQLARGLREQPAAAAPLAASLLYLAFDRRLTQAYDLVGRLYRLYLAAAAQAGLEGATAALREAGALAATLARRGWQQEAELLQRTLIRSLLRLGDLGLQAVYCQGLIGQLAQHSAYQGFAAAWAAYSSVYYYCLLVCSRCGREGLNLDWRQACLGQLLSFVRDAVGAAARASLLEEGEGLACWAAGLQRLCHDRGLKPERAAILLTAVLSYYQGSKPKSFRRQQAYLEAYLPLPDLPRPYRELLERLA